jgi:hypothetical protein
MIENEIKKTQFNKQHHYQLTTQPPPPPPLACQGLGVADLPPLSGSGCEFTKAMILK